jgi:hypothetical protein
MYQSTPDAAPTAVLMVPQAQRPARFQVLAVRTSSSVRAAQKKATADTPHATKALRRRSSPIVPSMWEND